jgi:hypothetical protein
MVSREENDGRSSLEEGERFEYILLRVKILFTLCWICQWCTAPREGALVLPIMSAKLGGGAT